MSTPRWGAARRLDLAPFAPFDVVNEKVTEKKKRISTGAKYLLSNFLPHYFRNQNRVLHHSNTICDLST